MQYKCNEGKDLKFNLYSYIRPCTNFRQKSVLLFIPSPSVTLQAADQLLIGESVGMEGKARKEGEINLSAALSITFRPEQVVVA